MQISRYKTISFSIVVIAVILGAVTLGVMRQNQDTTDEVRAGTASAGNAVENGVPVSVSGEAEDAENIDVTISDVQGRGTLSGGQDGKKSIMAMADVGIDWNKEEAKDSECIRLSELLDEGTDNEAIMAQAVFLAMSDSPVRRHSVIAALNWLGTPETVDILSELQNDSEEEIADDAFSSIEHFFDTMINQITTDPDTGELVSDRDINEYFDTCTNAIKNAENIDNSDILMTKTAALDVKLAIPILLDVIETGNAAQREIALNYLDIVTHGDGVTNREEAMLWLLEDQGIYMDSTENK